MAQDNHSFDLIVIGGGPGGYVAAIRAAQLGMSVACVERDALGGVCLNWGCIPTKALLAGAELYHRMSHQRDEWGITCDNLGFDWEKVIGRSRGVAGQLNKGVGFLFKKHKITHIEGHAFIPEKGKVEVYAKHDVKHEGDLQQTLSAKHIVIATGARPRPLPGVEFDGDKVISSKDAMVLRDKPEKLLVVGAGAIGMEFAYFYNAFDTEVTVVEMVDRLLPIEDEEVSKEIAKAFKKQGVTAYPGHKTLSIEKTDNGIQATIAPVPKGNTPEPEGGGYGQSGSDKDAQAKDKEITIEADKVLVAIGVQGRYDGLFGDALGIETYKDHIKVDYHQPGTKYQTSVEGIHAIGDVIGPPWLAHVASEEGILCVERIAGHEPPDVPDIDYHAIPGCTYCVPQVASIGYTEKQCKEQNLDYTAAKFPFQASGKAQALGETAGFVKMITGKKHGEILGCHMIGEGVTELIAEIGAAMKAEATVDEVIQTIHAHPTMSEAVHEAALGTDGRMIHF